MISSAVWLHSVQQNHLSSQNHTQITFNMILKVTEKRTTAKFMIGLLRRPGARSNRTKSQMQLHFIQTWLPRMLVFSPILMSTMTLIKNTFGLYSTHQIPNVWCPCPEPITGSLQISYTFKICHDLQLQMQVHTVSNADLVFSIRNKPTRTFIQIKNVESCINAHMSVIL